MMVFFKERLAYLAVPKTGTSAIERALQRRASAILRDPPGLKHTTARGYERKFRAIFERGDLPPVQTVAVMREPVEWLGSWFRYRQRPALQGHKNSTEEISFDDFVAAYLLPEQPPFAAIGSQGRFLSDASGDLLVNHLFRYDDLPAFTRFMERKLDQDITLPEVNVSPKKPLNLSAELREALQDRHRLDFQIYAALGEGPLSIQ